MTARLQLPLGILDQSPVVAGATRAEAIRLGTGGVLLSHYSALKVAENFRMLERAPEVWLLGSSDYSAQLAA